MLFISIATTLKIPLKSQLWIWLFLVDNVYSFTPQPHMIDFMVINNDTSWTPKLMDIYYSVLLFSYEWRDCRRSLLVYPSFKLDFISWHIYYIYSIIIFLPSHYNKKPHESVNMCCSIILIIYFLFSLNYYSPNIFAFCID